MRLGLSNKKALLGVLFVLVGIIYFYLFSFQISTQHNFSDNRTTHIAEINTRLNQAALINIVSGGVKPEVLLNGQPAKLDFPYPETRTTHRDRTLGDVYQLPLSKGKNELHITFQDGQPRPVKLSQQYTFVDFLLGFIALAPLLYLLFIAGTNGFNALIQQKNTQYAGKLFSFNHIPLLILLVGILLRLWYALDMGYIQFQHDYHGHIEYIKFFAHEFFIPLPHKAWEFPQQPVYYIFNGLIYATLEWWQLEEGIILRVISFTTAVLSCIGLIYAYRLLQLLSESLLIRTTTLGFLCFVPSLVYMSSRINNDPWAFALACIALFYIISSYQSQWQKHVIPALLFTSLVFLTKVSALTIELVFFGLLVISYLTSPAQTRSTLLKFYFVGVLLLSYTLFRGYYPAAGVIQMVNSGIWPGQDLRPLDFSYFFSFNFADLLQYAQTDARATDNITVTRRSFLTYQYGTLLFGEFNYSFWRNQNSFMFLTMQLILVLGLIIPLGWFISCFRRKTALDWLLALVTLVAIVLVLRFAYTYPSVANTDFRYYCPVFFCFAYFFACGLDTLSARSVILRRLVALWLLLLFSSCIALILMLIQI